MQSPNKKPPGARQKIWNSEEYTTLHVLLPNEMHARLKHHAHRIGATLNTLSREGIAIRLQQLDEAEAVQLANQTKRFSLLDERQKLIEKRDPKLLRSKTTVPIPEKFEKSFTRYAEFLEAATGQDDRARRANEILDDIRTRVSTPEEELRVHEALQEFLTARKNTKVAAAEPTARLVGTMLDK